MSYQKVVTFFPMVKRVPLDPKKKVVYKSGACTFRTKQGKDMVLPEENIVYQDKDCVFYKTLTRKIFNGEFEIKNGFLVDEIKDIKINPSVLSMGEKKKPMSEAEQKAFRERFAKGKASAKTVKPAAKKPAGRPARVASTARVARSESPTRTTRTARIKK